MKIKIKNIITVAVIMLILGIVFNMVNAFTGNPVSAAIAAHKIRDYAADTYPMLDLELTEVKYNFKNSAYGCYAQSRISEDTKFYIGYSHGKVSDDYEFEVANSFTTYRRLSGEFNDLVTKIIEKEYPHETTLIIGDFIGDTQELTLDMPFEMNNIPLPATLTVYILSEERGEGQMASLLLELHQLMLSKKIAIGQYSIRLEEPLSEEEKPGSGDNNYLIDFPAEKIMDDITNLTSVIREYQKETKKYEK